MILVYRPIDAWPGRLRTESERRDSPFKASWPDTLALLEREVGMLAGPGAEVVLQVAGSARDMRLDGGLRADARPSHPGVIVSFEAPGLGPLRFHTDVHGEGRSWLRSYLTGWKANVRAIALGLEALRKVERYGVGTGSEQYTGWQQLPPGTPMGPARMTVDEAARLLVDETGGPGEAPMGSVVDDVVNVPDFRKALYRDAAKRLHPDNGGDAERFKRLQEAWKVLTEHT